MASLFGGLALANAGLGAVHGFAGPIGGMFPAPHGAVCAALLPHVMAANVRALRERALGNVTLQRYEEIARILIGSEQAPADDGVEWVGELVRDLQVPRLGSFGIRSEHVAELVAKAAQSQQHEGESDFIERRGTGRRAAAGVLTRLEFMKLGDGFCRLTGQTQTMHLKKISSRLSLTLAALLCSLIIGHAAPATIQPGEIWPDNRGQHVQAHGGGIIKVGDTFYWFGEDRSQDQ